MPPLAAIRQKGNNADNLSGCPIVQELEEYFQGKTAEKVPSPLTSREQLVGNKPFPAVQPKSVLETLIEKGAIKGDLAAKWKKRKEKQKKEIPSPPPTSRELNQLLPSIQPKSVTKKLIEKGAIKGDLAAKWKKKKGNQKNKLLPAVQKKRVIETLIENEKKVKQTNKLVSDVRQNNNVLETLIENGAVKGDLAAKRKKKGNQKKEMVELLDKAEQGDAEAMYEVGVNYYCGDDGFQEDDKLAYYWFQKAHAAGVVRATAFLGEMFVKGIGVAKNYRKGTTYLGMAAKELDGAAYQLGMAFATGMYGLPIDTEAARHLLRLVVSGACPYNNLGSSFIEQAKAALKELNDR